MVVPAASIRLRLQRVEPSTAWAARGGDAHSGPAHHPAPYEAADRWLERVTARSDARKLPVATGG